MAWSEWAMKGRQMVTVWSWHAIVCRLGACTSLIALGVADRGAAAARTARRSSFESPMEMISRGMYGGRAVACCGCGAPSGGAPWGGAAPSGASAISSSSLAAKNALATCVNAAAFQHTLRPG